MKDEFEDDIGMSKDDAAKLMHDIYNALPERPDPKLVIAILHTVLKGVNYTNEESRNVLRFLFDHIDILPDPPPKDHQHYRRKTQ